jgi:GAF domain-containing protein
VIASVEWLVIVAAVTIFLAVGLAVTAALAAGRDDLARVVEESERAAIWEAGYGDRDLRVLAGLAAAAHAQLCVEQVEIVLAHVGGGGDGVVVTGSRVDVGRLGNRIGSGEGLAGRGLAEGRSRLTSDGNAVVPIWSRGRVVGVITVTAGDTPLGRRHIAHLESLAAEAGRRLGRRSGMARHAG